MGTGQFIAALHSLRVFGVVILFAAASLVIAILPVFGGDWAPEVFRELGVFGPQISLSLSLFFAVAGLLLAVFLPARAKQNWSAWPHLPNPAEEVDPTSITVLENDRIFRGKPPG